MTTEERFERIEHVTAGLAAQFQADREENRRLWRETQNQIAEVDRQIAELGQKIAGFAEESKAGDKRLEARINQLAEEARAEDKRLAERIESLVSAMGEALSRLPHPEGGSR